MSHQLTPVWSALARHLRRTEAMRDFALLAAIGALASFAILFTSRVAFDDVVHELSLSYASSAVGTDSPTSDLRLILQPYLSRVFSACRLGETGW